MRAYRFERLDSLNDLAVCDEPMPVPQRGELLLRIHAVALNYRDLSMVLGNYVHPVNAGLIPCSDAAGEVVAVGDGVTAHAVGDRVVSTFHPRWFGGRPPFASGRSASYGSELDGWLVQYKAISQEAVAPLPPDMSYEEGATLPCAGTTAFSALSGSVPVRAGQTVLTLGTGGVSIFAVQIAKALGATVIATTSTEAKAQRLRELGSDHVVNYVDTPEWGRQVREITGATGVDCVVEVGGPATINQSLRAVRWGGDVVLIGFLSSENPGIDYFHLKRSGATVRSISVGDRPALEDLIRLCRACRLKPVIDRVFEFEQARAAFEHLEAARHVGKIVIRL